MSDGIFETMMSLRKWLFVNVYLNPVPKAEERKAEEMIRQLYEYYKKGLADLPVTMNPIDFENSEPNYWLSAMLIDRDAMCRFLRGDKETLYITEPGKSCPSEILEVLSAFNAEGRPIWKPMHAQPIYRMNPFVTIHGNGRALTNAYIKQHGFEGVGDDIFNRGLCLPGDNKMTKEQLDTVIELIHRCFL